jgi:hypothetical protein
MADFQHQMQNGNANQIIHDNKKVVSVLFLSGIGLHHTRRGTKQYTWKRLNMLSSKGNHLLSFHLEQHKMS